MGKKNTVKTLMLILLVGQVGGFFTTLVLEASTNTRNTGSWSYAQQEIHIPEESEITLQEILDIAKPEVSGDESEITFDNTNIGNHYPYRAGEECDGTVEVSGSEGSGTNYDTDCMENWARDKVFTSAHPDSVTIPIYSYLDIDVTGGSFFSYVDGSITLIFDNITPTIETNSDSLNVGLGDDKLDYKTVFNPTITGEKVLNDNTIAVDDSCSYNSDTYNKVGACTIEYVINDDDSANTQITKDVTVNVVDTSDVMKVGSDSETKEEEIKPLTDSELIELFKVRAEDSVLGTDLPISVDATAVDYDHPGDYKVTFSTEDSIAGEISKDVTLTLSDTKPEIVTDKDSIDVSVGDDKLDYETVFNPTITGEKALNDNTIAVDDSCFYNSDTYNKAGACTIEYAINDDDSASTKITKTVTINVTEKEEVDPTDNGGTDTDNGGADIDNGGADTDNGGADTDNGNGEDENTKNVDDSSVVIKKVSKPMSIAKTGLNSHFELMVSATLVIVVVTTIKYKLNRKVNS